MTGNNILVGGSRTNHKFLYAYVGNRIFKSINSGTTWSDKGENFIISLHKIVLILAMSILISYLWEELICIRVKMVEIHGH